MKIKILSSFNLKLSNQLIYIAEDKPKAARKFRADILSEIKKLTSMPYKHRKSLYFENNSIRDLIYKGYVLIYRVNESNNIIEVFEFIKHVEKP